MRINLPAPSAEARAHSELVTGRVRREIEANAGWLSFARYMELALYAPGLGYYMAGARKLGRDGDFVTAPELSPLFARCLARQLAELAGHGLPDVLELGAGSGVLAAGLLRELAAMERLPERYFILEVSADLRERQRDRLRQSAPQCADRMQWLEVLPRAYTGVIIGNEVLDAIPTHVVVTRGGDILEAGVRYDAGSRSFLWHEFPAPEGVRSAARTLGLPPDDYKTEINLAARAFVRSFARLLERGVLLFADYGFPAREYYHPQRARGTLMCHYRHRAHDDPFFLPGLQDITSHVDFSAIAQAGAAAGLDVLGYTHQAQFLVNCGITDLLAGTPADDPVYARLAAGAQTLLSPAEMGELVKVIALGKGVAAPLLGFSRGDRHHTL
ncbi:MAG: SAM-dependent methyltransferase [Betaproteobacteria bacterium]|nr:SAM-dependent methyltransferase [Betaproteobacteria bacterium]